MNDLNGRVAFVTGASGGQLLLTNAANWRRIGAAIARTLATFPLKGLALHYSRSFDAAKSVREEIAAEHPALNVTLHQADLAEPEQCESLAREVLKTHAKIDIFISNAGGARRITDILYHVPHFKLIGVSRQVSWEEFDRTLNLNLRASFILTKELIAPMREQRWGRIVFVSSIAAQGGGINGPHYAASKGGLTGLMKNLSTRLAEFNISVNDVAPAMIEETGMIPSDEAVGGIRHKIPVGRLGKVDEVANAVAMFVNCGYITGQSLLIWWSKIASQWLTNERALVSKLYHATEG